jgi:hypothetical protein
MLGGKRSPGFLLVAEGLITQTRQLIGRVLLGLWLRRLLL